MRRENMQFVQEIEPTPKPITSREYIFNLIDNSTRDWISNEILEETPGISAIRTVQSILNELSSEGKINYTQCRCHKTNVYSSKKHK